MGGILLAAVVGCDVKPSVVTLDVTAVAPTTDVKDLAAVLKRCVDKNGFIDVDKYRSVAGRLERQLARLAVSGPDASGQLYPTADDRLAYWYNARAAWSIALAMRLHNKEKKKDAAGLKAFLFPLNGRQMTLEEIDRAVFALGGYQAVVAAPGAALQCAALPEEPFTAQTIRRAVRLRFGAFVDDWRRFVIDVETQQIRFPPVLWRYRESILAEQDKRYGTPRATFTTAMLPLVSGSAVRRLQDAVGYTCVENIAPDELTLRE
ncbi:MAG: hypothetical protein JW849_05195 [Phycisphaerae bacterium]|nr:hypothetical protein [Phycisphaerae bacterium]